MPRCSGIIAARLHVNAFALLAACAAAGAPRRHPEDVLIAISTRIHNLEIHPFIRGRPKLQVALRGLVDAAVYDFNFVVFDKSNNHAVFQEKRLQVTGHPSPHVEITLPTGLAGEHVVYIEVWDAFSGLDQHDALLAKKRIVHRFICNPHKVESGPPASFRMPLSNLNVSVVNGVSTHEWWRRVAEGTWEPGTLRALNQEARVGMVYVGFGEWTGVTGLFAAQRVKRAILVDADPMAYEELRENVRLNQAAFGNNMQTDSRFISWLRGKVKIRANGASYSSIFNNTWTRDLPEIEVDCISLPELLADYGATTDHVFVKIDAEGAEALIVPLLYHWIATAQKKPTIFLSMHNRANSEQRKAIAAVLNLFPFYAVIRGKNSADEIDLGTDHDCGTWQSCKTGVPLKANPQHDFFTPSMVCNWCDYLLVFDDIRATEMCPVEQASLKMRRTENSLQLHSDAREDGRMRHPDDTVISIYFLPRGVGNAFLAAQSTNLECCVRGLVQAVEYKVVVTVRKGSLIEFQDEWRLDNNVTNITIPPLRAAAYTMTVSVLDLFPGLSIDKSMLSTMMQNIVVEDTGLWARGMSLLRASKRDEYALRQTRDKLGIHRIIMHPLVGYYWFPSSPYV